MIGVYFGAIVVGLTALVLIAWAFGFGDAS